jgi:4-alpha-glucanotransferase
MRFRRGILEQQAAAFFNDSNSPGREDFERFVRSESELDRYAEFRAVVDRQGGWTEWPSRLRDGDIHPSDYDSDAKRYHLYAQWRIQSEMANLSARAGARDQLLYLDLPLGLHPDSYDIWRYRDLFVRGAAGGAPPDPVFTKGQNWGFPPMHPEAMRLRHYDYTIAYIRNHLRYARMLRIDHVMGLHRLFWIPQGFTGDKGVYVEYPADEMYAILSLESHRHTAGIVGENLGTVPPAVNSAMERHNIQQMYVLQYEAMGNDPAQPLPPPPLQSVASLNTHDMPPFRAFLEGLDIEDRLKLHFLDAEGVSNEERQRATINDSLIRFLRESGLLRNEAASTPGAVFQGVLEFLAGSMARVVLVNLEDLWQEVLPQNVPATQSERPNWRRRTRLRLEEIVQSKEAAELLKLVERKRTAQS